MKYSTYITGAFWVGGASFIIIWIYMLSYMGPIMGLLFGWLVAVIGGIIIGALWPLLIIFLVWSLLPFILYGHF